MRKPPENFVARSRPHGGEDDMDQESDAGRAMALEAYIAHQIPGRVRLKIPAAKGRVDLLERIAAVLGSAGGIRSVECNPATGSMLINYTPSAYKNVEALSSILGESKLRVSMRASRHGARRPAQRAGGKHPQPSAATKAIESFFRNLDREVRDITGNELDLAVLLPAVVVSLGLLTMRRRASTPLWLTLLIFAFHSFTTLRDLPELEEAQELGGGAADGTSTE
jgi:hypothetical protein